MHMFDFGQICFNFIANSRCSIPSQTIQENDPKITAKGPQGVGIRAFKKFQKFLGFVN